MSFAIAIFHSTGKWLKKQSVESQAGQTLQGIGSLSGICVTALPANADSAGISIGTAEAVSGKLIWRGIVESAARPASTWQVSLVLSECFAGSDGTRRKAAGLCPVVPFQRRARSEMLLLMQ
jgi:hypothetical protein